MFLFRYFIAKRFIILGLFVMPSGRYKSELLSLLYGLKLRLENEIRNAAETPLTPAKESEAYERDSMDGNSGARNSLDSAHPLDASLKSPPERAKESCEHQWEVRRDSESPVSPWYFCIKCQTSATASFKSPPESER